MSTFLGLWFLLANVVIIVLTSAILAGGFVPRRVVRRLQEQNKTQQVDIARLAAELHRQRRVNAALARGLFKPATPSPTTRLPGPQDVPTEEWVRNGRS